MEDQRQTAMLQEAWVESGKAYGHRKLHDDLLEQGESVSLNRVARLTRLAGIKAQIGYKRRPGKYGGKPSIIVDNTLDRQFDVAAADQVWVTDITYIRTHEGFAYLAVVIDLYSRRVVGWSMQSRQTTDVVLQALLMAIWRRKPRAKVLIYSDQGRQFTSMDWAAFLRAHKLQHSMSRRGNCHDNAVAESFFNLLKRERIRRRTYRTRAEARQDVFDYIEMFYNPKRKHAHNGMLSPIEYERRQKLNNQGVQETRGYSDLDLWAYAKSVTLDFSRPGKPTDNGFIDAFNSKLRSECLNAHWFMSLADASEKLEDWRRHYNDDRPHSAIGYNVPSALHFPDDATSP